MAVPNRNSVTLRDSDPPAQDSSPETEGSVPGSTPPPLPPRIPLRPRIRLSYLEEEDEWICTGYITYPPPPRPSKKGLDPNAKKKKTLMMTCEERLRCFLKKPKNEVSSCKQDTQKVKLEDTAKDEENLCAICMEKVSTHAFIPCGHRVVCGQCSKQLQEKNMLRCVICREDALDIFQIF